MEDILKIEHNIEVVKAAIELYEAGLKMESKDYLFENYE